MSKVILYIATSLDGFIADTSGGVDWLPHPSDEQDVLGYQALLQRISAIVMGRRTYEQVVSFGPWEWCDKKTYVFTEAVLPRADESITFVQDDVRTFMENFQSKYPYQNIWLFGGAQLIASFSQENLIDECIITIVPVKLGNGIPLQLHYAYLILEDTKTCFDGIIQKYYIKR